MKKLFLLGAIVVFIGAGCRANNTTTTETETDTETNTTTISTSTQTETAASTTEDAAAITIESTTDVTYTSESWKTIVPDTCQTFTDGCNTCNRAEGSDVIACTKKACMEYERPTCLDAEAKVEGSTTRRRVEVLKSNKQRDPNANKYDFGTNNDPDVVVTTTIKTDTDITTETKATDYNSSRSNKSL